MHYLIFLIQFLAQPAEWDLWSFRGIKRARVKCVGGGSKVSREKTAFLLRDYSYGVTVQRGLIVFAVCVIKCPCVAVAVKWNEPRRAAGEPSYQLGSGETRPRVSARLISDVSGFSKYNWKKAIIPGFAAGDRWHTWFFWSAIVKIWFFSSSLSFDKTAKIVWQTFLR